MSVFVDLSSEQLDPESIMTFVKAHVKNRPEGDLLFKVSRRALELYCGEKPKDAVAVSKEELKQLNEALGGSFTAAAFLKRAVHKCEACGRVLTFFDFFQSGRKHHGHDYISGLLGKEGYHLHIQKRANKLEIDCTQCGTKNVLTPGGYDGPNY
jgi:hypothetical protein